MNTNVVSQDSQNQENRLSSTLTLDDLHQEHLSDSESSQIISDIHTVQKFSTTTDPAYSLVGDCGQSASVDILQRLDAKKVVMAINNGSYRIVRTPNLEHWDMAEANTFMSDPTIVCGVGFFFPFEVTPTYILWRNSCSSGMLPTDVNGTPDPDFIRCLQAQEVISKAYHLQD